MPTFYVTAPREAAQSLAKELVENRLAACVNIVECESVYWWEETVTNDAESILFIKTASARARAVERFVEEHHPYDVPCIERFEEDGILYSYAQWRDDVVQPTE